MLFLLETYRGPLHKLGPLVRQAPPRKRGRGRGARRTSQIIKKKKSQRRTYVPRRNALRTNKELKVVFKVFYFNLKGSNP